MLTAETTRKTAPATRTTTAPEGRSRLQLAARPARV
jgi:hypothetical protein